MGSDLSGIVVDFEEFAIEVEPRLFRALVAAFGPEIGAEACAEAMAFAWEHWERVSNRPNPAGYLWGVGRNKALRRPREQVSFPTPTATFEPWVEPALAPALSALSERQRVAVLLVHGSGWTHREVAEFVGVTASSVQRHVERAMAKLRRAMGVER